MYAVTGAAMFDDLFDLSKKRSFKQSVGFYLFYLMLFIGASTIVDIIAFS
jgi:hypothetical protein